MNQRLCVMWIIKSLQIFFSVLAFPSYSCFRSAKIRMWKIFIHFTYGRYMLLCIHSIYDTYILSALANKHACKTLHTVLDRQRYVCTQVPEAMVELWQSPSNNSLVFVGFEQFCLPSTFRLPSWHRVSFVCTKRRCSIAREWELNDSHKNIYEIFSSHLSWTWMCMMIIRKPYIPAVFGYRKQSASSWQWQTLTYPTKKKTNNDNSLVGFVFAWWTTMIIMMISTWANSMRMHTRWFMWLAHILCHWLSILSILIILYIQFQIYWAIVQNSGVQCANGFLLLTAVSGSAND